MSTRVLTDTATIAWDEATLNQVKGNVPNTPTAKTAMGLGAADSPQFTNQVLTGFLDLTEIAAPASPAANVGRVYAVDDGSGVTTIATKDNAGNVVPLSHLKQSGTGAVTRAQYLKLLDTVSVKDFGAVASNNGTPGNGTDDRAAFNNALTYCASSGSELLVPAGKYRISDRLDLTDSGDTSILQARASIRGEGSRSSFLIFDNGNFNGLTVTGTAAQAPYAESMQVISGLGLYKVDGLGKGLVLDSLAHVHVSDVIAQAWDLGVYCADVQESLFENLLSIFNLHGFQSLRVAFTQPNALNFVNCMIANNQNWGLDIHNAAVVKYNGGSIESNGAIGVDPVQWGARIILDDGTNVEGNLAALFSGTYFERNADKGDIYYTNSVVPMSLTAVGCNFNRGGVGAGPSYGTNCVRIETSGGFKNVVTLVGNGFGGLPRSGGGAYPPSAARPYIGIVNATEPLTLIDIGNRYTDVVETPVFTSGGGVSVLRTESSAEVQVLTSNNADANPGPYNVLFRDSASPAASDFGGVFAFDFRNASGTKFRAAQIAARILDATAGSEDIETEFFNYVAGAAVQSFGTANGAVVGSPTGGYQGTGTLNAVTLFADQVNLRAGTTSLAPVQMSAGTNLTTAAAGAVEYDGKAIYATAVASSRQVINAEQVSIMTADRGGSDSNTAQNVFGSTEDEITLAASTTYEFEAQYFITRAAGTNSHTTATLFGGTATLTSIDYLAQVTNPTGNALANVQQIMANAATAVTLTAANTVATENLIIWLRGTVRVNGAGTLVPQFQFQGLNPGGAPTVKRNTFFRCWPIGTDAVAKVGNWS